MRKFSLASLILALVAAPLSAQTVFRGQTLSPGSAVSGDALTARNLFLGSLSSSVATESFETQTPGTIPATGLDLNFGFAGNATLSATSGTVRDFNSEVFATHGTQFLRQTVGAGESFGVTFEQHVAGFGFYGTDLGDFNGRLTLDFYSGAGLVESFLVQDGDLSGNSIPAMNNNLLFWGVLYGSNAFDRVDFRLEGTGDVFGFDQLTVADAQEVSISVPEPASAVLLLSGFVGLAVVSRRRRE